MHTARPRVLTCAAGDDPLRLIAQMVFHGSGPGVADHDWPQRAALHEWRILLPTRRAVRRLGLLLTELAGGGVFLPRIEALGDLEEQEGRAPYGLARQTQLFGLMAIASEWATANPQLDFARSIAASPPAALALARSLLSLIDQIETEEVSFDGLTALYDYTDLAGHHEAVTGLLGDVQQGYAKLLKDHGRLGHAARRNAMIRAAASFIQNSKPGPVLAAGSTGTNPATRELLKVIAHLPQGAVVLPGLDVDSDDADWLALTPTHPQWGLKQLVEHMGVVRRDVKMLGGANRRAGLIREAMRPSARTDQWRASLAAGQNDLLQALGGLHLVECQDRHEEALAIALILRESLEKAGRTAALVTPDRDLAVRVKAELARWDISIDDSAGEPLLHHGTASLLAALLDWVTADAPAASIMGLLRHVLFAPDGISTGQAVAVLDLCLRLEGRITSLGPGAQRLAAIVDRQKLKATADGQHGHPVARRIEAESWEQAQLLARWIHDAVLPLEPRQNAPFAAHVTKLCAALEMMAPRASLALPENQSLVRVLQRLQDSSAGIGHMSLADAAKMLRSLLAGEIIHPARHTHPRLAIYGLAEARMMRADVMVLGGLFEGAWPAQPDSGPWLNRPMREAFGLSAPERDIGLTAHDFAEGASFETVHVTWPKRKGLQPTVTSRWVLRLRTLMNGLGLADDAQLAKAPVELARRLDAANGFVPVRRPDPKPPFAARPRHYSVTEIEKLIRDPYAIYAAKMLLLRPLPLPGDELAAAMRGSLFHAAFETWNRLWPHTSPEASSVALHEAGREALDARLDDPHVAAFWWPRFARIAEELPAAMATHEADLIGVRAELPGFLRLSAGGEIFSLLGRIDRLDIFTDGTGRIIDYKTGTMPGVNEVTEGLAPQLALLAHMVENGAFRDVGSMRCREAFYVGAGGGRDGIDFLAFNGSGKDAMPFAALVGKTVESVTALLAHSLAETHGFVPRRQLKRGNEQSDFDHLSRYLEWQLAEA